MLEKIEPSDQKGEKVNSAVNAVVIPLIEQARRDAEAADDARRRCNRPGKDKVETTPLNRAQCPGVRSRSDT